jgi:prephenate dehydratase
MRIGYLGPRGTITEEALLKYLRVKEEKTVPYLTVYDVVRAVERREVEKGLVPIENSIEGSVNVTLDLLAFETDLFIEKEIVAPVSHNLLGKKGVKLSKVKRLISNPQAAAQCGRFLREKLPRVEVEPVSSTAEAARRVAESEDEAVAIGTKLAAKIYGLEVIQEKIEDFEDNLTRFVLLGREIPPPTGYDKTSIVCFIHEDRPGSLLEILQEFAYRYINLTKIVSRPTKKTLGDYCFFIDLEGHVEDEVVSQALHCLECKLRKVKVLGSYPRGG